MLRLLKIEKIEFVGPELQPENNLNVNLLIYSDADNLETHSCY